MCVTPSVDRLLGDASCRDGCCCWLASFSRSRETLHSSRTTYSTKCCCCCRRSKCYSVWMAALIASDLASVRQSAGDSAFNSQNCMHIGCSYSYAQLNQLTASGGRTSSFGIRNTFSDLTPLVMVHRQRHQRQRHLQQRDSINGDCRNCEVTWEGNLVGVGNWHKFNYSDIKFWRWSGGRREGGRREGWI